jgi:DNA-binding NarL/FixJ family response regulator
MIATKSIRAVLVDDSALVRERLAAFLAALDGVEVAGQAADIPSGAMLLRQTRPDVLLLDLDFRGEDGTKLLETARQENPALVIIMFTNHDHPKLRQQCARLGADFYFHKATEFEKMLKVCQDLAYSRIAPKANPKSGRRQK